MKEIPIACPCGTKNPYDVCCKPFHEGRLPENALKLMRARYSAYARNIPDYIMQTTHPASPQFGDDSAQWACKIADFCSHTKFKQLEVLDFQEQGDFAAVTFFACLIQGGRDASFTERSYFEKRKGKWLYRNGQLIQGRAPQLIPPHPPRQLPLAYYNHPILRKVADPVGDLTSKTRQLVEEMIETMDIHEGIGLAAPQIYRSEKIFVIRVPVEREDEKIEFKGIKVFINPEITLPSTETWKAPEGCLSIPTIEAEVERPRAITVEYTDLEGNRIKERVSGWEARIILHENDHLNGVLFVDHVEKNFEPLLNHLHRRIYF